MASGHRRPNYRKTITNLWHTEAVNHILDVVTLPTGTGSFTYDDVKTHVATVVSKMVNNVVHPSVVVLEWGYVRTYFEEEYALDMITACEYYFSKARKLGRSLYYDKTLPNAQPQDYFRRCIAGCGNPAAIGLIAVNSKTDPVLVRLWEERKKAIARGVAKKLVECGERAIVNGAITRSDMNLVLPKAAGTRLSTLLK